MSGKYGYLYHVGSFEHLAELILKLLDSPSSLPGSRERAYDFTVESISRKYVNFIDTLVKNL